MPARFPLGQVVATPGALEALAASGENAASFLRRHVAGDYGDVCEEDKRLDSMRQERQWGASAWQASRCSFGSYCPATVRR